MRGLWLLYIGAISTVLANPVPEAQPDDQIIPQEISTDENDSGNEFSSIPDMNGNNNRIALGDVGNENAFYGTMADSVDQINPEGVDGYEVASEWWMNDNDKTYTDFQCGNENSVCCTKTIIGPLTRSKSCSRSE